MGLLGEIGTVSLIFSVVLCVHAVRTGQQMYWLFIILFLMPLGGIVYLVAVIGPDIWGGKAARNLGRSARQAMDPDREYREAKTRLEDSPTAGARLRLASAAMALGRYSEAEALYAEAMGGIHAEDPAMMLGRAQALLELDRAAEAMALLQALRAQGDAGRSPPAGLAFARAYEALGEKDQARKAYEGVIGRLPGLEALARYCAFLARSGETAKAKEIFADLNKQYAAAPAPFRKEAKRWRDFAAAAF